MSIDPIIEVRPTTEYALQCRLQLVLQRAGVEHATEVPVPTITWVNKDTGREVLAHGNRADIAFVVPGTDAVVIVECKRATNGVASLKRQAEQVADYLDAFRRYFPDRRFFAAIVSTEVYKDAPDEHEGVLLMNESTFVESWLKRG